MTLHDLEAGVKGSNLTLAKDLQTMISKLFSNSKRLGSMIRELFGFFMCPPPLPFDIKNAIWQPFCFKNMDIITLRPAVLAIYILCKSETASYILEHINDFLAIGYGGHVVF